MVIGMKIFLVLATLSLAQCFDIEAELMKGIDEIDNKLKQVHSKNEDDDLPDADSVPEDAHLDRLRLEDDIILDKHTDATLWKLLRLPGYKDVMIQNSKSRERVARAVVTGPVDTLWPGAVVPFYIDRSRRRYTRKIVSAVLHLEKRTCIKFPRIYKQKTGMNYIQIVKGTWASSRLGMEPAPRPQRINLHDGFLRGNLIHEFMHALGFLHEHSRPDRGKYLVMSSRTKRRWNFKRADVRGLEWESMGIPYDYGSITHYSAASMRPRDPRAQPKMGQRYELTDMDICQLNRMYKCHDKLDEMGTKCDCLDSYTAPTCEYLKKKGYCSKKKKILDQICPNTCGVCCQSNCEVNFQKIGCFAANHLPREREQSGREAYRGLFFDRGGFCSLKGMKSLKHKVCRCAKLAKKRSFKFFTITKSGNCVATSQHNYKAGESESCMNTQCQKCQYSNVQCAQGESGSLFLYKLAD
uniref:Metalloendopeptidase n=1 Tax=Pachycerianthus borealis TaxID=2736680 RepID=A0A7G7WYQ6_9CNID|nr:toxin candidate TRINITY_DN32351_c0_g1_i1 [Pachycerianthus borealis]